LRVRVDGRGTRGAVHVDPLLRAVQTWLGGAPGSDFGIGFAWGDFNGDGYDDALVGTRFDVGQHGSYGVYAGSPSGLAGDPYTAWISPQFYGKTGETVDAGGDVDGDGHVDGVVSELGSGTVHVLLGSAAGLPSSPSQSIVNGGFKWGDPTRIVPSGDGDGYDDLLVSDSQAGRVHLLRGGPLPIASTPLVSWSITATAIAAAGDLNGDGRPDLAIGDATAGRVYIKYGGAGAVTDGPILAYGAPGGFGGAIDGVGDVDGDGYDDLLVGDRLYAGTGAAWLVYGGDGGPRTGATALTTPDDSPGELGSFLSRAGDVNGDGYADVVVGSTSGSSPWWLYHGGPGGPALAGPARDDVSAALLTGGGDANGDGYADLAVINWPEDRVAILHGCPDADGDGYCQDLDCDDMDPARSPDAAEVCGGVDDDCDGLTDDDDPDVDPASLRSWHRDRDHDGYGDAADPVTACAAPADRVEDASDCDDARADVHPGVTEVCGGVDEDCDGLMDDADPDVSAATQGYYWSDLDDDGYGAGDPALRCVAGPGEVGNGSDCDDLQPGAHPGAVEVCGGGDDDCDGAVDDDDPSVDTSGAPTWYQDGDADGWGGTSTTQRCAQPVDHVGRTGDCDDGRAEVNPDAAERCDGADDDCDGLTDDADPSVAAGDLVDGWRDADADGWGAGDGTTAVCPGHPGYAAQAGDCDDSLPLIHPDAQERCGAGDEDCDQLVDDDDPSVDVLTQGFYWPDVDQDTYGDAEAEAVLRCLGGAGLVGDAGDCDDRDGRV
ncbi:MAG TPA: MopE-related protein, partial [Myxococcota bacterium]|nr:MopE-related protein [Myxococcota bacterium]